MDIIEQTLIPKSPTKKSEDGIVVTPDYIAVIDGSTSKTRRRHCPWMSNGRYAMWLVSRYLRKMPADHSCHQFCKGVTSYIMRHYRIPLLPFLNNSRRIQQLVEHTEERLTCSAIIYSRLRREIWMIGDCLCLVDGTLYENPKPQEAANAAKRAMRITQLMAEGVTQEQLLSHDTARDEIIPDIIASTHQQNISFSVIDGFPIPKQYVPILTLDFQPHEIVFSSDGYPFLCPTLDESERRLREQRDNDPLNISTFLACKGFMTGQNSFDDRSYIRFLV